jgi:hypothetical protein
VLTLGVVRGWEMVRTQVQLTEVQARRLRRRSREEGISLAEAIRRAVDRMLAEPGPDRSLLYRRAAQLVGKLKDRAGARDLSMAHDRYLDEEHAG